MRQRIGYQDWILTVQGFGFGFGFWIFLTFFKIGFYFFEILSLISLLFLLLLMYFGFLVILSSSLFLLCSSLLLLSVLFIFGQTTQRILTQGMLTCSKLLTTGSLCWLFMSQNILCVSSFYYSSPLFFSSRAIWPPFFAFRIMPFPYFEEH